MPSKTHILITGSPGVGKTTLIKKIEDYLKENSLPVGGLYSPEIKTDGKRQGFALVDIHNGKKGILASKTGSGPKVGKYAVNKHDLDNIGVKAIESALRSAQYVLIDEIAPMELKSKEFMNIVEKAFSSSKIVIAVIHKRSKAPFIQKIKNREDVILWDIHKNNQDIVYEQIIQTLKKQDHHLH